MKNKILVNIYVPKLLETYNVYIPVNERVLRIKELLIKAICDLSDGAFPVDGQHYLIDSANGLVYPNATLVRESNIKNGKNLILF